MFCSFNEGIGTWINGIDMLKVNDFLSDVWYNKRVIHFRESLIGKFPKCPSFKV